MLTEISPKVPKLMQVKMQMVLLSKDTLEIKKYKKDNFLLEKKKP